MIQYDMTAGVGSPPVQPGDLVYNVSRIGEYLRCPARYAYKYLENRVPAGPEPRYLKVGRIVHRAAEMLHDDPLNLDTTLDELDASFDALLEEMVDEKQRKTTEREQLWAHKALAVYQQRVLGNRFGWKTIVAQEEAMWLRLLAGERNVYLVGTPDKIVVGSNDRLRHVQFKTMSPQVDPNHFAMQTRFSAHETVYAFMIEGTYGEQLDLPYQGTELIMLPKVLPPSEPVNRTKDGRVTEYYRKQLDKFEQDKAAWEAKVLDRRMLALGYSWRRHILNEIADAIFGMHALQEGVRPYVRAGGGACNRYGGPCGYLAVCAGEVALDGSAFQDRVPDYVDEVLVPGEAGTGDPGDAG